MQIKAFPLCCTAKIICDFGGTRTSEGNQGATNEKKLKFDIQSKLDWYPKGTVLVATTNSTQRVANRVLKELGFFHSKWMYKSQHRSTKLRVWWKQAGVEE